jgi:hypothetical protein
LNLPCLFWPSAGFYALLHGFGIWRGNGGVKTFDFSHNSDYTICPSGNNPKHYETILNNGPGDLGPF